MTGMVAALSCPNMPYPGRQYRPCWAHPARNRPIQQRSSERNLTSAMNKKRPPSRTAEDRNAGSCHSTICPVEVAAVPPDGRGSQRLAELEPLVAEGWRSSPGAAEDRNSSISSSVGPRRNVAAAVPRGGRGSQRHVHHGEVEGLLGGGRPPGRPRIATSSRRWASTSPAGGGRLWGGRGSQRLRRHQGQVRAVGGGRPPGDLG